MNMLYITRHIPDNLDYKEAEARLCEAMRALGVCMEATYIPWSRSKQAKEAPGTLIRDRAWHWRCVLWSEARKHDDIVQEYMAGPGIQPTKTWNKVKHSNGIATLYYDTLNRELETGIMLGQVPTYTHLGNYPNSKAKMPKMVDVFAALLMDGSSTDFRDFSEWALEYGESDDSIKAKATYDECLKIGLWLNRVFGQSNVQYMRKLAYAL